MTAVLASYGSHEDIEEHRDVDRQLLKELVAVRNGVLLPNARISFIANQASHMET